MNYQLQFLKENDMPEVHQAFMEAFSDYVQSISHVTEIYIRNRAILNGVDFSCSVGAYGQGKMVGFLLAALDEYFGKYAAYDAMTGIIKPYRGQGLAKAMFDVAVPQLRAKGAKSFYLEVIQKNHPAVRAYEKSGFSIIRELHAFEIDLEKDDFIQLQDTSISIRPISQNDLSDADACFDWQPSWGSTLSSIQRIPDEVLILGAYHAEKLVGLLVYYPLLKWVLNLAVHKSYRRQKIGTALVAELKRMIGDEVPQPKIFNIDHQDEGALKFFRTVGKAFDSNQFEMRLEL